MENGRMDVSQNLWLAAMDAQDLAALQPSLKPFAYQQHHVLFEPGEQIPSVYFPFDAAISLVVMLSDGEGIEAAMMGHDGMVGAGAALDGRIAFNRGVVQLSGRGLICEVAAFRQVADRSPAMRAFAIRHE